MAERDVHMTIQSYGTTPTSQDKEKVYRDSMKQYVKFLENKIDQDLGFYFWKRYTAAAFWTQVSTPINLVITLMTALTTAQSASNTILQEQAYQKIAIATLVITTLNTFFRPHIQLSYNTEQLTKWNEIGIEFENAYYSNRGIDTLTTEQIEDKVEMYKGIQEKANGQRKSEGVGSINFITDLIHLIAFRTCIHRYKRWLDRDRQIQKKADLLETKEKKNTEIQNKSITKKETFIYPTIDDDLKIQIEAMNIHQKAQEDKIKRLELLMFAKSPKCLTNGDSIESLVARTPPRTRANTPITPTSIDTPPTTTT
jgi:hypothetical protein